MNKNKLFIGNLHYSVTEDQLRALFAPYGNLISVKVMPGKGYGFIEMGTPEQAQKIKDTLSESVFQGRRLLIDGVPSKQSETRKWASISTEPRRLGRKPDRRENSDRRTRTEASVQPVEQTHHLIDVTDEFKKSKKPEPKPEKPEVRIGQYATPASVQKSQKAVPSGRDPQTTRSGKQAREGQGQDQPKGKNSPPPGQGKKTTCQGNRSESDRRSGETKPKKIKEKPPKNPHPYQGSKKSKSVLKPEHEQKQDSPETQEDERVSYLKYMASRAGKKE